jgi:branched-chain amino acid transport system substrate-binding protein
MNLIRRTLEAALCAATLTAPAWAQVKIAGLYERSGAGATAGANFETDVDRAIEEINAAGGILGLKIEHSISDTPRRCTAWR